MRCTGKANSKKNFEPARRLEVLFQSSWSPPVTRQCFRGKIEATELALRLASLSAKQHTGFCPLGRTKLHSGKSGKSFLVREFGFGSFPLGSFLQFFPNSSSFQFSFPSSLTEKVVCNTCNPWKTRGKLVENQGLQLVHARTTIKGGKDLEELANQPIGNCGVFMLPNRIIVRIPRI